MLKTMMSSSQREHAIVASFRYVIASPTTPRLPTLFRVFFFFSLPLSLICFPFAAVCPASFKKMPLMLPPVVAARRFVADAPAAR